MQFRNIPYTQQMLEVNQKENKLSKGGKGNTRMYV